MSELDKKMASNRDADLPIRWFKNPPHQTRRTQRELVSFKNGAFELLTQLSATDRSNVNGLRLIRCHAG